MRANLYFFKTTKFLVIHYAGIWDTPNSCLCEFQPLPKSDCLKKWGKKILKCVTLFLFLPSCLPFVSNNTAIPWACCIILSCRLWGSPGGLVMCVLAFCSLLLLLFENYWYREWVIISSPQPLLCEKKPVKMNIWQRNCPDLRRKFPGFMISFFCSSINWRLAEEESLLHSYLEARGGMG